MRQITSLDNKDDNIAKYIYIYIVITIYLCKQKVLTGEEIIVILLGVNIKKLMSISHSETFISHEFWDIGTRLYNFF